MPKNPDDVALKYPAMTAYKQWVWREIRKRAGSAGALQWLVDEMRSAARTELVAVGKYETLSTSALSQLLGPEDEVPPPSSSVLLPAINKTLGLPPPPVCDPTDDLAMLIERFRAAWQRSTPRERSMMMAILAPNGETTVTDDNSEQLEQYSNGSDRRR